MADVRIDLKPGAIGELLKSEEVRADLDRRAQQIAAAAGPGHRVESEVGRNRARAAVITDTFEARFAEATSRNLSAAVDAGRD